MDNRLNLGNILNWGYLDIRKLDETINKIEVVTAKSLSNICDEIREELIANKFPVEDINSWLLVAHDYLVSEVVRRLRDEGFDDIADKLEDSYDPFINYFDSWTNTVLDEITDWKSWDNVLQHLKEAYHG